MAIFRLTLKGSLNRLYKWLTLRWLSGENCTCQTGDTGDMSLDSGVWKRHKEGNNRHSVFWYSLVRLGQLSNINAWVGIEYSGGEITGSILKRWNGQKMPNQRLKCYSVGLG